VPESGSQLPGQSAESPAKPLITEPGANEFPVETCCRFPGLGASPVGSLPKQFHPLLSWHLGRILHLIDSLPAHWGASESRDLWVIESCPNAYCLPTCLPEVQTFGTGSMDRVMAR